VLFATPPRERANLILAIVEALRAAAPWLYRQPAPRAVQT
jgi:hypothetical protein